MRWGIAIDLGSCTGCGACVVACRQENNVPVADEATRAHGRAQDWIQLVTSIEGTYEDLTVSQRPLMCQQCEEPPCIKVCPVQATYKDGDGLIGQIYGRCIGCRYCTNACPYSVKTFNWFTPSWPGGSDRRQNPDVSIRPRGVVEKCTFCHHRYQKAKDQARYEGREVRRGDYVPACVEICPAEAMAFGDLDDPESAVASLAQSPHAERFLEDLGTEPKVIYVRAQ